MALHWKQNKTKYSAGREYVFVCLNLIWSREKKIIFKNSLPQVYTNIGRLRDRIRVIFWPKKKKKSKHHSWIPDRN